MALTTVQGTFGSNTSLTTIERLSRDHQNISAERVPAERSDGRFPSSANGITCAPIVVNSSPSSSAKSLHHSVDTLDVSLWLDWFIPEFFEELDSLKAQAQDLDIPFSVVDFDGQKWNVKRFAPGYFRHHISCGDVTILLSTHKADSNVPNCKIEIGSLSCWSGVFQVFAGLKKMLTSEGCKVKKELVSRVDLAVDLLGVPIAETNVHDEDFWICKAHSFGMFRNHRKLTGITYGKGDLMLRIYDKVQELKTKQATAKQEAFATIWGVSNYEEKAVTRTEFQLRRGVLKNFQSGSRNVNKVDDLQENLSSLWTYCVETWSRHNSQVVDRKNKNQSQALPSTFWEKIKSVSWVGYSGLSRVVSPIRKNISALKDQMRGIAVTLISSTGLEHDDYFNIMATATNMLSDELHKYMVLKPLEYMKKFEQRRGECLTAYNF